MSKQQENLSEKGSLLKELKEVIVYELRLGNFYSFCIFLFFKGLLLVMINGSKKKLCVLQWNLSFGTPLFRGHKI